MISRGQKELGEILILALVYVLAAKLGLSLAFATEQVTTVWPPTGIALAALLLFGQRLWPGVFLGALIANLLTNEPLTVAGGIALGNTLEAVVGVYLLRRFADFRTDLARIRDVFALVAFGTLLNTAISATIGVFSLASGGLIAWSAWMSVWLTWWVGDIMGAIIVTPLILLWSMRGLLDKFLKNPFEPAILGAFTIFASVLVFTRNIQLHSILLPSQYLFPVIVWAAIRFSQTGVTATSFFISAIAIWGTLHGRGPFSYQVSVEENLIQLQLFMFVVSITSLMLGAVVAERKRAQDEAQRRSTDFKVANRELQQAMTQSHEREGRLNTAVQELEETKKAMLNVLEDLEQNRAAIEKEKAQVEALLDSAGEGIVAVDREGLVLVINKSAKEMIGVSGDIVNQPWKRYDFLLDQHLQPIPVERLPLIVALSTGQRVETNLFFRRQDKSTFPIAITAAPIRFQNQVIGAVKVFRNMTKEMEIDRAKNEFVTLASHQLRTPLSAIKWYTEMLQTEDKGKNTTGQKKYLQAVWNSSQRMIALVNALLNVSRIETGTFAVESEQVNITDICQSVLHELTPELTKRQLKLKKKFSTDVPLVTTDPKLIRIVIQNLLSNAMKYTAADGQITLTVRPAEKEDGVMPPGDNILMSVKDTGCGIPAAQQKSIFTKMFRADNARNIDQDGTGLGLYIAKAVVDRSGGKIWFESQENVGTTFFVLLPVESKLQSKGNKPLL